MLGRLARRNVVIGRMMLAVSVIGWLRKRARRSGLLVRLKPDETMTVTVHQHQEPR